MDFGQFFFNIGYGWCWAIGCLPVESRLATGPSAALNKRTINFRIFFLPQTTHFLKSRRDIMSAFMKHWAITSLKYYIYKY